MERVKIEKEQSVIKRQEVQDFISDRQIKPEDFYLIEKLATFPKDTIIQDLHNLFNMYHERSGNELDRMIKNVGDSSRKELYESIKNFYQKYDWAVSWSLIRLLEKI